MKKGVIKLVAKPYSVSEKTASRIWKQGQASIANGMMVDVSCKLLGRAGRKRIKIGLDQLATMSLHRRTNIRSFSRALNVTKSTLHRRIKECVRETIFIQQDNAKPHIHPLDVNFLEAAREDGFDICLACQPPQSPDMNVLDLGFFRAIQSLQHQEAPTTIDELVYAVEKPFEELSPESLDRIFLTWQACMLEVMKFNGGNNYKLPHMNKSQLTRCGVLPSQLQCEREL
ncbi:hypothetical protein Vadar_023215 [Vaccinium darrowii]|uniref:Uncharacterized protein n=1 Tax=Vaccinium darrowii TaxID=229202 RepID=A0ACB7YFH4_9ERIC|nr:hypothetical protein Vadar_023215 [Vaccinium darrowii]